MWLKISVLFIIISWVLITEGDGVTFHFDGVTRMEVDDLVLFLGYAEVREVFLEQFVAYLLVAKGDGIVCGAGVELE